MLSKFIGILVLAFVTQADEGEHWLMKRALDAHDLNETELDGTACAKEGLSGLWSTWQRRPTLSSLKRQQLHHQDRLAMQQQFTGMVVNDHHVSPYSVPVPSHMKKNLKQTVTPWQPHSVFPYAIPKQLQAVAKAHSSRGGGHHYKMVHRRRFPWSNIYPRFIKENAYEDDDEEDAELAMEAAAAAREAARVVMEQGTLTGPAMAAEAAEEAAARAKARVRARRSVAAAAWANTSDGLP
eukprot:gnl/MRDRNA2_/MRDRNA2_30072_c0_seq2.p1 gnl/MRDRNA2_/MRDRNA2_30072_c0~~gnl/MRDRNA2_/MRDRNA2_30072_c0_seq2.p1  ORF type:complete len:239 (+),score=58.63 gnl/MRDRNA2_/MRDRNA2_30072_c0_seq2:79-795(+)